MNQYIQAFLDQKSDKKKIIVVYGPTASGKTDASLKISKSIHSEIISTDSRQIYKYMNIGTGKILPHEQEGVKHHMIDIVTPDSSFSVGQFKKDATSIINEIHHKKKVPILCGGTGLYIDSLLYNFDIPASPENGELRKNLELEAEKYGKDFVYNKLKVLDPIYAQEVHPNNLQYVIRAIEVKILTGRSKAEFRTQKSLQYDTFFYNVYDGDRQKLYSRINERVQSMFDAGFIDEVKSLLSLGYKRSDPGMQTIGYKEICAYLDGEYSLDHLIDLVKQHNRNYAKRQLTWFSKYSDNF